MAYRILSPTNSFVQFSESGVVQSCSFADIPLCLPVFAADDVAFQFVVEADTIEEADALCSLTEPGVSVGLARDCQTANAVTFAELPDRYRISDFQVLYNWAHGFPNFTNYFDVGDCFVVRVNAGGTEACSNCFNRISAECHTSVLSYSNEDDAFGFSYCSAGSISGGADPEDDCEPTYVQFTNQATLTIPYTAALQAKYGTVPTIKGWLYDTNGELVNMGFHQAFDTFPPTELRFDFGGSASGVIKIS